MNDEGVGIHVIQRLEKEGTTGADLMDGGTGGFHLLGVIQSYKHVIFIDASLDQYPPGTIRVIHPEFARDFPQQLSAHEIGLKDLIESCGLLGTAPHFHLIAISVSDFQDLGLSLTPEVESSVPKIMEQVKTLVSDLQ
jgi:hydrogenase maturation protease